MREIKFRGRLRSNAPDFNKKKGDWVTGYYIQLDGVCKILTENGVYYAVDPETVGQDTGLKDKNGEKIHEGDVVLIPDEYTEHITDEGFGPTYVYNHLSEVKFINGSFLFEVREEANFISRGYYSYSDLIVEIGVDAIEIVGNIHENPELLK